MAPSDSDKERTVLEKPLASVLDEPTQEDPVDADEELPTVTDGSLPVDDEDDDEPPTDVVSEADLPTEIVDELPTDIVRGPLPLPDPPVREVVSPLRDPPERDLDLPLSPDELERTNLIAIDDVPELKDQAEQVLGEDEAPTLTAEDRVAPVAADEIPTLAQDAKVKPIAGPPDSVDKPAADQTHRVPRGLAFGRALLYLLFAGALVAAGGTAWVLTHRHHARAVASAPPPTAPTVAPIAVAPVIDAGAAAPAPTPTETTTPGGPTVAPIAQPIDAGVGPAAGEPFTTSFARQGTAIDDCVGQHPKTVGTGLTLKFRFRINADGSVRTVKLLPLRVGRTALGKCLKTAAHATRFAPRKSPVTVTIPLAVQPHG